MTESSAYTYRLTEDGDLILGGAIPEYDSPELYPHYVYRDSVLRVIALPGTRIATRAVAGYPNLHIALLSDAVSVATEAFCGCPMLAAIQLSPRTLHVAPDAFRDCPRLFCLDYAGTQSELEIALYDRLDSLRAMLVRTLPAGGTVLASGRIGDAEWTLDDGGVLTVSGGAVPDQPRFKRTPWHAHLADISHLVIGEGVARVGERVFSSMPALRALTVVGDTEIADFAFASCDRLTRIDLFSSVRTLGLCSLAGVGVRELMLPPSLTRIPEGLLQSAYALKTLVLPVLPAVADAPFLDHCEALTDIRLLGTTPDRRALTAALYLPPRIAISCFDPSADQSADINEAFLAAERAIGEATASYGAARQMQESPRAHIPRIPPLIDEAERGYLTLERFAFEPDGRVDTMLERMSYRKRAKILKEREKERKEERKEVEAKTERGYKYLGEAFEGLLAALKRAADAVAKEEKDLAEAKKQLDAAEASIVVSYPLDGRYRERAAALRERLAVLASALPSDILPNAMTAISEYKMLITYHRFDDLRRSLARVSLLLDEHRTESEEERSDAPRVSPRILVAGGDHVHDRSTAACIEALRRAGALVEWVEPEATIFTDQGYDALLLCDGETAPSPYGGLYHGLHMDEGRAKRDSALFSAFYLYGKPIMGIGRGAQQINLYLAGTMRWNLNAAEREMHTAKNGKPVSHSITVVPDNALSEMYDLGGIPMRVLSDHSSAIRTLGRELVPIAKARDGMIEAFVHRRVPLIGVQFALDRMLSDSPKGFAYPVPAVDDGMTLFRAFVKLAVRVRENPPVAGSEERYSRRRD